jgi:general secretion pathway protein B
MSFILDALKKSEGERQRQSGPAMFEVRVAPPRSRVPVWAAIVGGLLLVNLVIVAWLLMRAPAENDAIAATAQPTEAAAPAPAPARVDQASREPVAPSPAVETAPARSATEEPLLTEQAPPAETEVEPGLDAPVALETPRPRSRVTRGTVLGIPTYDQLGARPGAGLPELRLDVHVYADEPAERFVFLNNRRLREGEALPDGTRVESIVPDGVVLTARNQRFLLQRE